MKEINLNGSWLAKSVSGAEEAAARIGPIQVNEYFEAKIPGDIHRDLERAGKIPNPYFGDNMKACAWVAEKNWCFVRDFEVDADFIQKYAELCFDGVDTFARVYLNGRFVGECSNMFRPYRFEVNEFLRMGQNRLCVVIESTAEAARRYPHEGYLSCFHHERIFIRKAQCHFSWDWAPELLAAGIYQSVYIRSYQIPPIEDVFVKTANEGYATFFFERRAAQPQEGLSIRLRVNGPGFAQTYEVGAAAAVRQYSIKIENPRLWWPAGLGEQSLYTYRAELVANGECAGAKEGTFAFREISVDQTPRPGLEALRFTVRVNGVPVFLKGANWVPADIFTGTVDRERYEALLRPVTEGNMNCLRVWGGGLYEKDDFYRLCDELGILVWQDFMFACSEIPEDFPGFLEEVTEEISCQIRRLRNHPSIFIWCGGNENPGSISNAQEGQRGGFAASYLFRGLAGHLDGTRPYVETSPWGYEQPGNCLTSGDTHLSSMSAVLSRHASEFRHELARLTASMMTEIAAMGSSPVENIKKYIPEGHLWPPEEIWYIHTRDNPYDGTGKNFVDHQMKLAREHFGQEISSLEDFAKKSAVVQAEHIKADVEFHRSRAFDCSGTLLWMYNDIWPCGSWSIVDYYRTKKAGYYAMKRACRPVLPIITLYADGYKAVVSNETRQEVRGTLRLIQQTTDGATVRQKELSDVCVPPLSCVAAEILGEFDLSLKDSMLFICLQTPKEMIWNSFIQHPFSDMHFVPGGVHITEFSGAEGWYRVRLRADTVSRVVCLKADGADFSDNYFDLPAGADYEVQIVCEHELKKEELMLLTFCDEWR